MPTVTTEVEVEVSVDDFDQYEIDELLANKGDLAEIFERCHYKGEDLRTVVTELMHRRGFYQFSAN